MFEEDGKQACIEHVTEIALVKAGITGDSMDPFEASERKRVSEEAVKRLMEEWDELGSSMMSLLLIKTTGEAR